MRTKGPQKVPPLPPLTQCPPGAPGDGLSPPGKPVTLQFMSLAFQFHRQMVGGALAQTEHLSPQTPTDMWAPTTHRDAVPLAIPKDPPDTPWKPQVQCIVFKSEGPFLGPPAPEKDKSRASGRASDTYPEGILLPIFYSSKTHLCNYPPELRINTRCQSYRTEGLVAPAQGKEI